MSKKEEKVIEMSVEEVTVEEIPVEEIPVEKTYTIRNLSNKDLWPVMKILGRLLPEDLKKAFLQVASGEKKIKDVGKLIAFDMGVMIIQNAYKAQEDVDAFCASMIGVTVDELNDMEFGTTAMIIMDLFEDAKRASFFKALSKFFS